MKQDGNFARNDLANAQYSILVLSEQMRVDWGFYRYKAYQLAVDSRPVMPFLFDKECFKSTKKSNVNQLTRVCLLVPKGHVVECCMLLALHQSYCGCQTEVHVSRMSAAHQTRSSVLPFCSCCPTLILQPRPPIPCRL